MGHCRPDAWQSGPGRSWLATGKKRSPVRILRHPRLPELAVRCRLEMESATKLSLLEPPGTHPAWTLQNLARLPNSPMRPRTTRRAIWQFSGTFLTCLSRKVVAGQETGV